MIKDVARHDLDQKNNNQRHQQVSRHKAGNVRDLICKRNEPVAEAGARVLRGRFVHVLTPLCQAGGTRYPCVPPLCCAYFAVAASLQSLTEAMYACCDL